MDYLNYFGFEDVVGVVIDSLVFLVVISIYVLTRKSPINSWLKYFNYSMGMLSLSYLLPVMVFMSSFFVFEDMSEKYSGVITLITYYIPLFLAGLCFVGVYKNRQKNA